MKPMRTPLFTTAVTGFYLIFCALPVLGNKISPLPDPAAPPLSVAQNNSSASLRATQLQSAEKFIEQKQFESAVGIYQEILAGHPGDLAVKLLLARVLRFAGNFKEAGRLHAEIRTTHPDNSDNLVGQGLVFLAFQEFDKALANFQRVLELSPDYADARQGLNRAQQGLQHIARDRFIRLRWQEAEEFIQSGNFKDAIRVYENTLIQYPGHFGTRFRLGRVHTFLRQSDKALSIYNELLSLHPDNADVWTARGHAHFQSDRWDAAREDFQRALELNPKDADAAQGLARMARFRNLEELFKQARTLQIQGKYQAAETLYRQLVKTDPQNIEAQIGLAHVLSWRKKLAEARTLYNAIRQSRPDLPDGDIGLLRLEAWEGRHSQAEEGLKSLLAKYPQRLDILLPLGRVTGWQGKFQASIDTFQKALELYPDNMEVLQGLAATYQWMNEPQKGIVLYSKVLAKDPENLKAIVGVGILHSQDGEFEKAISFLEKARELAPGRTDIRAMLGTLYGQTARLDDAVTELQKSVALERGDISSYIALGRVYSWQKKTEQSIKLFKQALEFDPENIEVLLGLGRTYRYNDQWQLAEEFVLKALKIRPGDVAARKELERLRKVKAPQLTVRYNFFEFRDHDPATGQLSTVFRDHRETTEYFHKLSSNTTLQARYQRSDQKQQDKVFNETDFNIDADIGSIGLIQKLPDGFGLRLRYDFSRFNNDGDNVFNLLASETDHAGFFILSKRFKNHYFATSFGRELFIDTLTGDATVESINTYLVAYDVNLTDHFSVLVSASLDDLSIARELRQDHILRPRYRLPFYDRIELEYQLRYLSNPGEYENSFFINFQNQFKDIFLYQINYAVTHNSIENSLEHAATLVFKWDIAPWISWSVDARYAIETLDDEDILQNYQTYLTMRF